MLNQSTDYQVNSINSTQLTGLVKGSAASRQVINQSMFTDPNSQNSAAAKALRNQAQRNKINKPQAASGKIEGNTSRYGDNYPNKHGQLEELPTRNQPHGVEKLMTTQKMGMLKNLQEQA